MNKLIGTATNVVLVCTAVAVGGAAVKNQFFPGGATRAVSMDAPRQVSNPMLAQAAGWRHGPADAQVTIVEFADYQCPACAGMQSEVEELLRKYEGRVALRYRHFPLVRIHKYAYDAALAAECAGAQGVFREFSATLFSQQGAIGQKTWADFARDAGVPNQAAFARCLQSPEPAMAVDRDTAAARELGLRGTPEFIVGDRMVIGYATKALDSLIQAQLKGISR